MRPLAVIVLAAGRSSRFAGATEHKLLATVAGVPVVRLSVRAALHSAVGEVVVVTGFGSAAVEAALSGLPVRFVHAPNFAEGMAASMRTGITSVRNGTEAAIVALGDQPLVRPEAYRRVAHAWRSTAAAIVVPRYQQLAAPMHPILFAAGVYDEILTLRGDTGARSVIAADPARVVHVDLHWPAPRDVDTAEDLAALVDEARASDLARPGPDSADTGESLDLGAARDRLG